MTTLRPYQAASFDDLRARIRSGDRRLLVCAPTGSGKTELAMAMIHRAVARGHRVAFLVERLVLIEQTVARLAAAGIPTGVQQAGHSGGSLYPVQVCSQQTLEARDQWPTAELVIVDECHVQRRRVTQWLRHGLTDRQVVIGLTATPFARGLGTTYEQLVTVRTTNALIDEGWLIPLRVFAATPIDMTGATTDAKTGEWREKDLTERGRRIVGDIVSTWVTRTGAIWGGPVKTLVFSATVAHGADLCAAFTAAGYRFAQVSYQDGHGGDRAQRIEQFRRGDLDGLISVDVLTRGFDVPDVLCLVDAHPYAQALGAYLQQLGRVMRPAQGQAAEGEVGVVLDHAENYLRFYADLQTFYQDGLDEALVTDDGPDLALTPSGDRLRDPWTCRCGVLSDWTVERCPACGADRPVPQPLDARRAGAGNGSGIDVIDGETEEVDGVGRLAGDWREDRATAWRQLCAIAAARQQAKGAWDATKAKKFALAQYKQLYGDWPRGETRFETAATIDPAAHRWVTSRLIAYWKAKSRERVA